MQIEFLDAKMVNGIKRAVRISLSETETGFIFTIIHCTIINVDLVIVPRCRSCRLKLDITASLTSGSIFFLAKQNGSITYSFSLCLFFGFRPTYSQFIPEGVLANVLGVLLVCFGGVVCYVVTKEDYRRPPNPEEESLSVYFKTLTEGQSPSSP